MAELGLGTRSQTPWVLTVCSFYPATQPPLKTGPSCLLFSRLNESDLPLYPLTPPLLPFHHPRGASSSQYNWSSISACPLGSGSRRRLMLWRPGLISRRLWTSVGWCCAVRRGRGSCLIQTYPSLLPGLLSDFIKPTFSSRCTMKSFITMLHDTCHHNAPWP